MDGNLKRCVDLLNENDSKIRNEALHILLRLCEKIVSVPSEEQYRRVRVGNPAILEKLLPASGAMECLFEMGFVEDSEYFSLPQEAPLSRLRQVQKALRDLQIRNTNSEKPSTEKKKTKTCESRPKIHLKKNFLQRVEDEFRHALKYEDPQLQSKARRVTPLEKLQLDAMRRLRELQREIKLKNAENASDSEAEQQVTIDDLLLAELLDWFKNEFFTWVDSPNCSVCGKTCQYERVELSGDPKISRIEIHKCNDCQLEAEFPRYTDPGILLKTRRGRCGEWANAFTLICRSLGFDARLVHDETDHVWTEVWSIASNRWIHADPCENSMDRPLMYERGWNKKLTYIMAYSRDEIQDVTWRYTRKQAEVMQRRGLCTEGDLVALILRLNEERQTSQGYSAPRKQFVTKRRALELVEMLSAPPGAKKPGEDEDNEYGGRTSGSIDWRTSRGEIQENTESFIWKIPQEATHFQIQYFAARDEYETIVDNDEIPGKKTGWQNGVNFTEGGIFRKVETDWKMVYLARSVGQTVGKISWALETADSRNTITDIKFSTLCETFHGAKIEWKIIGSHRDPKIDDIVISVDNSEAFETNLISGVSKIIVTAELSGGINNEAWQHAQIFRQKLEDTKKCAMSILIAKSAKETKLNGIVIGLKNQLVRM